MAPLREGPPARIEVRTIDHELSANVGGKRRSWAVERKRDLPVVSLGETDLEVSVLSRVCPASDAEH
jgi:hypothetical protein